MGFSVPFTNLYSLSERGNFLASQSPICRYCKAGWAPILVLQRGIRQPGTSASLHTEPPVAPGSTESGFWQMVAG
ncbi:hypothetical protein FKM82_028527 [Ascaphus truei]